MKKIIVAFFIIFSANAFASTGFDNCKNKIETAFSVALNSSKLNINSSTVGDDIAKILQPVFNNTLLKDPDCIAAKDELLEYKSADLSISMYGRTIEISLEFSSTNEEVPGGIKYTFPWYGILVVKKGSLDKFASAETPLISSVYMKNNSDIFFPESNNGVFMGMTSGCTSGNHMANDNDVINRAAHITRDENDSFWSGNDYYIYNGKDVYWGTATLVGEVALAVLTFGVSAGVQGGASAVAAAPGAAKAIETAVKAEEAAKLAYDAASGAEKVAKAAELAKATKAAKIARAEGKIIIKATTGLPEYMKAGGNSAQIIGELGRVVSVSRPLTFSDKIWRLARGAQYAIRPKGILTSVKAMSWKKKLTIAAATTAVGVGAASFGKDLLKTVGNYSEAEQELADGVKFNAYGLLSADDLEGRENELSHGSYIKFDIPSPDDDDDVRNEAEAFAEAFKSDIDEVNINGLCDLDIYVIRPAVGENQQVYYLILTDSGKLRVDGNNPS
ncbi:MAG TPA: hypothetical protein PKJ33_02195 [Alphaproteobacteria bacterium]|nr:hypothetical protein [Alphaproteobacteria bacterium]